MGEIQSADGWLTDIRVGVSGQAAEPCINRVDALGHGGEVAALNDLLDQAQLLVGKARVGIPYGDGRRDVGHARHVRPKLLQRHVGVERLVGGVGVHKRGRLVGHHLFQNRGDALALGEPLATDAGQQPGRIGLVEQDRARAPPVGERQPVHFVEQARRRRGRESHDGQHAQMCVAKARLQPAGQRLVGKQRVEVHGHLGHADAVPVGRDGGMEIGQRRAVIQPTALRHEAVEQGQHAVGAVDEAAQDFPRVHPRFLPALVEPCLSAGGFLGRGQPEEGEEVAGHEMRARFLETGLTLGIDQRRRGIGKGAVGIGGGFAALRLDEDAPAGAEAAHGIVDAAGDGD